WRRKALSKFLRQCGVAESFISTFTPEETKSDFLDRLFLELPKTDRGRSGLLRIATCLMDQRSFPDLQNWEDSQQKIKDADGAVSRLRAYHSQQANELQSEEEKVRAREEFRKRQEQVTRSHKSLEKLNARLNELG